MRRPAALALGLLGLCLGIAVLATTGDADPDRFLGRWRVRHLGSAALFAGAGGLLLLWAVAPAVLRVVYQAAVVVLVTWAILEALAPFVSYRDLLAPRHALGIDAVAHQENEGVAYGDIAVRWGLASSPIRFSYRTDGRGFRNSVDRERADVYLLGDSILVAGLVSFESTVTARLEGELCRSVMNVALLGMGPQEERDLFLAAELDVAGSLVLHFVFEGNDLLDSRTFRNRRTDASAPTWRERSFVNNIYVFLQKRMRGLRQRAAGRFADETVFFHWLENSYAGLGDELGPVTSALLSLRDHVEGRGGTYAVVYVPAKIRVVGPHVEWLPDSPVQSASSQLSPLRGQIIEWATSAGVDVIDLTDALGSPMDDSTLPWFPHDTHPNAAGHEAMATALASHQVLTPWRSCQ